MPDIGDGPLLIYSKHCTNTFISTCVKITVMLPQRHSSKFQNVWRSFSLAKYTSELLISKCFRKKFNAQPASLILFNFLFVALPGSSEVVSHSSDTSQNVDVGTHFTLGGGQTTSPTSADTQEEREDGEKEWSDVSYEESESDEGGTSVKIIDREMNADHVHSI